MKSSELRTFSPKEFFNRVARDLGNKSVADGASWVDKWTDHCRLLGNCTQTDTQTIRNYITKNVKGKWNLEGKDGLKRARAKYYREVATILHSLTLTDDSDNAEAAKFLQLLETTGDSDNAEVNSSNAGSGDSDRARTILKKLPRDMALVAGSSPGSTDWESQWNAVSTDPTYGGYMAELDPDPSLSLNLKREVLNGLDRMITDLGNVSKEAEFNVNVSGQAELNVSGQAGLNASPDTVLRFWATHHLKNLKDVIRSRFHRSGSGGSSERSGHSANDYPVPTLPTIDE